MSSLETAPPSWRNVTSAAPCQICNDKGWCSVSDCGRYLMCRRVQQDGAREHTDKHGVPYWIYRQEGTFAATPVAPPAPESDPDLVDRAYRALLDCPAAALTEAHRRHLAGRGLDAGSIARSGCRSVPKDDLGRREALQAMARSIGTRNLRFVPGATMHQGRPRLATGRGILIPSVSFATGKISALHVRADDGPTRYFWLSSKPAGPGPRLCAYVAFPRGQAGPWKTARVVEGEFKALVAAQITGVPTVSVPGVDLWSLAIPVLQQLGSTSALLAFDSDWRTNQRVARAMLAADAGIEAAGITVSLETWPAEFKGIDDFLTSKGALNR